MLRACLRVGLVLVALASTLPAFAQGLEPGHPNGAPAPPTPVPPVDFSMRAQLAPLREGVVSLTVAAILATVLAFRPRRRGTFERSITVAETQIILAVVGAMVMIVVGASLARAFGIVGLASLVRYRAKINDPKDAVVMLSTLGIGVASGVGLYVFAAFSTAFILLLLWGLESREPEEYKRFDLKLKIKGKEEVDALSLRPRVEEVLRRNRLTHEIRTATDEELCYDVRIPKRKTTDRLSNQLLALAKPTALAVEWDEKKADKS
jgi:hypothetical protein